MIGSLSQVTAALQPVSIMPASPAPASLAPASSSAAVSGPSADFGQILQSVVRDGVATLKAGEAAAIQGVEGKLPAQHVVESVLAAERAFQTGLALRDKVVSAFQELTRMSI